MRTRIYFLCVFFMSAFPEDMQVISVAKIGAVHVYPIDILYFLSIGSFFVAWREGSLKNLGRAGNIYFFFVAWVVAELILGLTQNGFRAIGESRWFLFVFTFFVPFALLGRQKVETADEVFTLVRRTILIAALASFLKFFLELWYGGRFFLAPSLIEEVGRFEDFRGLRILGSSQTYVLMLAAAMLVIQGMLRGQTQLSDKILIACLVIASLITQNRTGILSIVVGLSTILIFSGRIKLLVRVAVFVSIGVILVNITYPEESQRVFGTLLSGLNPSEDDTGSWRLIQFASAIQQGFESPLVGHRFGDYFYFEVPGMRPIEDIPHNAFLLLFLRTGSVGLLLLFASVALLVRQANRKKNTLFENTREIQALYVCLLVVSSQFVYGLAYPFIPELGVFLGFGVILVRTTQAENPIKSNELAHVCI